MRYVWLIDDSVWAEVLSQHAFYIKVKYTLNGINYEEIVQNDDFLTMEELGIAYESYE